MALQSIGDLAHNLVLRQQGTHLAREMDRLTRELSTGRATDTAKHLSGNLLPLADIERGLTLADAHRDVTRIAALDAGIMQAALGRVEDSGRALAEYRSRNSSPAHPPRFFSRRWPGVGWLPRIGLHG